MKILYCDINNDNAWYVWMEKDLLRINHFSPDMDIFRRKNYTEIDLIKHCQEIDFTLILLNTKEIEIEIKKLQEKQ